MFVYADPKCSFFLPVKFQAALVDRNDTELTCSRFIKVRNTTLIRRSRIRNFNELHSKFRREYYRYSGEAYLSYASFHSRKLKYNFKGRRVSLDQIPSNV